MTVPTPPTPCVIRNCFHHAFLPAYLRARARSYRVSQFGVGYLSLINDHGLRLELRFSGEKNAIVDVVIVIEGSIDNYNLSLKKGGKREERKFAVTTKEFSRFSNSKMNKGQRCEALYKKICR